MVLTKSLVQLLWWLNGTMNVKGLGKHKASITLPLRLGTEYCLCEAKQPKLYLSKNYHSWNTIHMRLVRYSFYNIIKSVRMRSTDLARFEVAWWTWDLNSEAFTMTPPLSCLCLKTVLSASVLVFTNETITLYDGVSGLKWKTHKRTLWKIKHYMPLTNTWLHITCMKCPLS